MEWSLCSDQWGNDININPYPQPFSGCTFKTSKGRLCCLLRVYKDEAFDCYFDIRELYYFLKVKLLIHIDLFDKKSLGAWVNEQ
jgi:hypothetical protein